MNKSLNFFLLLLISVFVFNSCIDEDFDQPPTTGVDPGLTANTTLKELANMHTFGNGHTEITDDLIIKGVVIADDFTGNWFRSFVIQDETAGIMVLINLTESYFFYPIGREVFIKLKGLSIDDSNNLLQVGEFNETTNQLDDISDVTGHLVRSKIKDVPAPKVISISQLREEHVNTLIQLNDVVFLDTFGTYADANGNNSLNVDIADCSENTVIVRTSGFADFAGEPVAKGGGSFVGVLSIFRNDLQLLIRNLDDIQMNDERCGNFDPCAGITPIEVSSIDLDFENGDNNDNVLETGWTNIATKGNRLWIYKEFDGNVYTQSSAFNDNNPEMEAWLVSPLINVTASTSISFESAKAFWTHNAMTVWVSTDFTCDPATATWVSLNATLAGQSDDDHAWIPSGNISLSSFAGSKVAIGFRYSGSDNNGLTGSYRIDNLTVN